MEGFRVRASVSQHQGGRAYMEDFSSVTVDTENQEACFAVYDGHGGQDAASFCQRNLWHNIRKQKMFHSKEDDKVTTAVQMGFAETQREMWNNIEKWSKHRSGLYNSTAGSTASLVVVRGNKLIVAHVGDSTVTLTRNDLSMLKTVQITDEHKPNAPQEQARIELHGGRVEKRGSVHRVAWKRVRQPHKGPVRRSTTFEVVPFLAVSRALGNLWSYDYFTKKYTVSPEPDICVRDLNHGVDRYIVIASDGIWNVMTNEEVTNFVHSKQMYEDVARRLVFEALRRWNDRGWRADNITAIVLVLDPEPTITQQITCFGSGVDNCDCKILQSPRKTIPIKRTLSTTDLANTLTSVKRHRSMPTNLSLENPEY